MIHGCGTIPHRVVGGTAHTVGIDNDAAFNEYQAMLGLAQSTMITALSGPPYQL
jgi:hypothetical protein